MLVAWRQLRAQIAAFDKAIRAMVRMSGASRLLMSVPGVGLLSALAYVSTVEDSSRFARSRSVGALTLGSRHDNINRARSIEAAGYPGAATP
jgi:transposase